MTREIVIIRPEESQVIEEMEKACFDHPWSKVSIEDDMMHDFSQFRALEIDGTKVGYTNIWVIDGSMELNRIAVLPEFRNKGYAKDLMDDLVNLCSEYELEKIILEVARDNQAAIKLYDKYDFKDIHVREKYYDNGADALIKVRMTDDF